MALFRGRRHPTNALVAAATKVNLADRKLAEAQAAKAQDWQAEAYAYFDEVPEIKESVRYRGNQLGKVKLYVAVDNPTDPDGDPVPVTDETSGVPPAVAAAATAELGRLRSLVGGRAEILRMLDMNLELAGECYLVGYGERTESVTQRDGTVEEVVRPEDWTIRSISEVTQQSGVWKIKSSPNDAKPRPLDPEYDTIIRIWTRHPQWAGAADSAMRGLLGECRTLQVLTQQVLAHANRSLSAGFFTVPNELSFGPADPTAVDADAEGESADPLDDVMHAVLVAPIENPAASASVQPGVLRGPAEYLAPNYLRRITFYDAELVAGIEARIEARVARIARGLNLPVEKVLGHQQTTFANAAQVDEDEYNDYLAPSVSTATDALTWAFLWPQMEEHPDVPPEWVNRLYVMGDPSDLIAEPDTEANADGAWDRGTISDDAYRKHKGYSADDAPDATELLIKAGLRRGILTADLTVALLNILTARDGLPAIELPEAEPSDEGEPDPEAAARLLSMLAASPDLVAQLFAAAGPLALGPAPPPFTRRVVAAAPTLGDQDFGRRLTELDRELRTRLVVAANDAMARALERAANRLRSKANGTDARAALRSVPLRSVFAHLGPTLVAQVVGDDDVLAGAWDDLGVSFVTWGAQAQAEALSVLEAVAGGRLSTDERASFAERQAVDLTEAWAWMADALTGLANARMYNPDPAPPEQGEFDPTLRVPAGLVRQAIARAGGATGLLTAAVSAPGPAWVTLTDAGTRPAGGIGTGELMRGGLRDVGASIEAYRWVYGPAFRESPFTPHENLDGVTFVNFDDAVLANHNGWPPGAFFLPGDHAGSLPAGVVVSGPAPRGGALRHWRGDLVDLTFASGQFLSATPNHPVLTRRGWVPAGELVEGDEVVRCTGPEGVAALVPHQRQVPARIEDAIAALSVAPGVVATTVEIAPEHFHGDGVGSDVAVVWAHRDLLGNVHAPLDQPAGQDDFAGAGPTQRVGLAGDGGAGKSVVAVGPPTLGGMGGGHHRLALLGRTELVDSPLGSREAAGLDATGQQALSDGVAIDAEALGQGLLGLPLGVEHDKVLHVDRRRGFSGHVYDLQTDERWYLANGVIVHNCVCDFEPIVLPPEPLPAATGGPAPESYPGDLSAADATTWMMQRWGTDSAGKQRAIMLTKLGRRGANDMASTMHDLMGAYPQTALRVRVFGSSTEVTAAVKSQTRMRVPGIGRAYADAQRQVGWIRLNQTKAKANTETMESLANDVASGFHPPGTASIASVVRHEFGHHVMYTAEARAGAAEVARVLRGVIADFSQPLLDQGMAPATARYEVMRGLSRYGAKSMGEFVAEAFSEVTSNPSPRPLAQAVVDAVVGLAEAP